MREKRRNFAEARKHVRAALAEMAAGRPGPYIDCWAASTDATLLAAWGLIETAYQRLADTFGWVGNRFAGGTLVNRWGSDTTSKGGLVVNMSRQYPR